MTNRKTRVRHTLLGLGALSLALGLYACSSAADTAPPNEGALDGSPSNPARSDASESDAASEATDASSEVTDANGPSVDAAPISNVPGAPGDRHPGVSEPIPDTLLIQNGGRFLNVTKPPQMTMSAAKGNGACTDGGDTKAFRDAFDYLRDRFLSASGVGADGPIPDAALTFPNNTYNQTNFWIYVPDGIYCVDDTLTYDGPTLQSIYKKDYPDGPWNWYDLTRVRVIGESRERTIIQLANNVQTFNDPMNPKPVLAMANPGVVFNNVNAWNIVRNLTIDVGKGNPGAAALLAQGANSMGIQNLLLRSSDVGSVGLWMPIGSLQGSIHDVTVQGFDRGVLVTGYTEMNPLLEYLTISGQKDAGVAIEAGYVSMRKLAVDESATDAPAVVISDKAAQAVLVDSSLSGGAGAAIDEQLDSGTILFVRNVTTTGYAKSVQTPGDSVTSASVAEFVSPAAVSLFDSGAPRSLALPVEDVPAAAWGDPTKDWANVEDFREGGASDDTTAAQAAFNSGKPVVVFPKTAYSLTSAVNIPATVQRIDFMYSDVNTARALTVSHSDVPLLMENVKTPDDFVVAVNDLNSVRNIAMKNGTLTFNNNAHAALKLWMESSGTSPSANFSAPGQQTWMHTNDTEYRTVQTIVNGGTLWMMGYKTEGGEKDGSVIHPGTVISATQGAQVEVLGGYTTTNGPPPMGRPMLDEVDASISFVGCVPATGADVFNPVVSETHSGISKTATYTLFSPFGNGPGLIKDYPGSFLIPLFVGR